MTGIRESSGRVRLVFPGLCLILSTIVLTSGWAATAPAPQTDPTVAISCPGLSSGPLRAARFARLSDATVLRCSSIQITQQQITAEIDKAPERLRGQLRRNAFFVLEQLAARQLLLSEARVWAATRTPKAGTESDDSLVRSYLQSLAEKATVGDEELRRFYDQNKDLLGGVPFEQVREDLREYLLGRKRQALVNDHIATLGARARAEVDEAWTKQQCRLAMDNPVDRARRSGRPSLVDFGATGCGPCDMMTPILAALEKKYAARLNVLFVHVREGQILAARYGVQTIPVQVFFDKDGKEVFRHDGFFPQEEIEAKLAQTGMAP